MTCPRYEAHEQGPCREADSSRQRHGDPPLLGCSEFIQPLSVGCLPDPQLKRRANPTSSLCLSVHFWLPEAHFGRCQENAGTPTDAVADVLLGPFTRRFGVARLDRVNDTHVLLDEHRTISINRKAQIEEAHQPDVDAGNDSREMVIARGLRNANVQLEVVLEKLVVAVLNPHLVLVLGTGFHGFDLPRICALRSQRCSSRVHNQLELVEVVEVSDGQRGDEVASERYDFDEPFVLQAPASFSYGRAACFVALGQLHLGEAPAGSQLASHNDALKLFMNSVRSCHRNRPVLLMCALYTYCRAAIYARTTVCQGVLLL